MGKIDVLSVGDVVTDAFVKLLDDQAVSFQNQNGSWLAMPFGVKIPFEQADVIEAVGNASNAAVSFVRLGLSSGLVSNIGDDQHGRDITTTLQKNQVDTHLIHVHPGRASNYHYVLRYKAERTILIKHEEYDYQWPSFRGDDVPGWIYFSSISKNAIDYHDELTDWLEQNPSVRLALQPGTFQIDVGAERLKRLYQRTEVLLLNREEAAEVSGGNHEDLNDLFARLHGLGPKIVCITDGPEGAYASDGQRKWFMPSYPDPKPPVDRTGAGDAFSSTFVAALIKGNTVEGALQWAPINSMSVVQYIGAREGLLTDEQIDEFLRKAPPGYEPREVTGEAAA